MKKTYEELQINVIALDNADVITASFATIGRLFQGGNFSFGNEENSDTQIFS